jgi:hypothetical protein
MLEHFLSVMATLLDLNLMFLKIGFDLTSKSECMSNTRLECVGEELKAFLFL